jgi:pilus assembly protein Flp/PilA
MNDMLLKTYLKVRELAVQDEGQDLVEYALLIALVALAAIAGLGVLSGAISKEFGTIAGSI